MAVDRDKAGKEGNRESDFINCVMFGRQAEFAKKYLSKGKKMLVIGRIQTGSYTNKEGNKVYTTNVVVERQEFAEAKAQIPPGAEHIPKSEFVPEQNVVPQVGDGFMSVPEGTEEYDGIPFI